MWVGVVQSIFKLTFDRYLIKAKRATGFFGAMSNSKNLFMSAAVTDTVGNIRGAKPPNIVIYGGDTADVIRLLSDCIRPDRYVFLPLDAGQVTAGEPWQDHAELLVLADCIDFPSAVFDTFRQFWTLGGKILCWRSPVFVSMCVGSQTAVWPTTEGDRVMIVQHNTKPAQSLTMAGSRTIVGLLSNTLVGSVLATDDDSRMFFVGAHQTPTGNGGTVAFSQVSTEDLLPGAEDTTDADRILELWRRLLRDHLHLQCGQPSTATSTRLTHCVVYAASEDERASLRRTLTVHLDESRLLRGPKVALGLAPEHGSVKQRQSDAVPFSDGVLTLHCRAAPVAGEPPLSNFRSEVYFRWLRTKVLGRLVVHADVATSTMDIVDCPGFRKHGLVCIAERQTSGKGRGQHVWLSPPGGAMFSVQLEFPLRSRLGERLPFVQHLCSLALAEGVRDLPGLKDLDIRLKWPNDIYFGDKVKLGGNIVRSTITGDSVLCTAGIGINVANESPTACVNSLIALLPDKSVTPCTTEQVIASALSRLEELLYDVQRDGVEDACERYYRLWLHEQAVVRLQRADGTTQPGTVIGLDEYGFLRVRLTECGSVVSVQPDGNSFDMLHNLVIVR